MYALAECNNFYVSCERAFNPSLRQQPIIILSNNSNSVIALSNEAKQLGINIGQSFCKIKSLCTKHCVKIYAVNSALYQDMSKRVLNTLELLCEKSIEADSIHEVFLNLTNKKNTIGLCHGIKNQVTQNTGIPISIGVGPTKTLAKAASYIAKQLSSTYVFSLEHPKMQNCWLAKMPIQAVWGVDNKILRKLTKLNIHTALDLKLLSMSAVHNQTNATLEKIHRELNGIDCHQPSYSPIVERLEKHAQQKSCLNNFAKLNLTRASSFNQDQNYYHNTVSVFVPLAANNSVLNICQTISTLPSTKHTNQLIHLLTEVNKLIFKKGLLTTATQGIKHSWQTRACDHSKCYTTQWQDLPLVK